MNGTRSHQLLSSQRFGSWKINLTFVIDRPLWYFGMLNNGETFSMPLNSTFEADQWYIYQCSINSTSLKCPGITSDVTILQEYKTTCEFFCHFQPNSDDPIHLLSQQHNQIIYCTLIWGEGTPYNLKDLSNSSLLFHTYPNLSCHGLQWAGTTSSRHDHKTLQRVPPSSQLQRRRAWYCPGIPRRMACGHDR